MDLKNYHDPRDPVIESMPAAWTSEQKQIAKDAMLTLTKHYPGWKWGIEYTPNSPAREVVDHFGIRTFRKAEMGSLVIRLLDVATEVVYVVNYRDIDKDRMHVIVKAGGEFLEALGLSRTKWRQDEVTGLPKTKGGIIVPYLDALPDNNPGRDRVKKMSRLVRS